MQKIIYFLIGIICFISFLYGCDKSNKAKGSELIKDMSNSSKVKFKSVEEKIEKIKIGMTKSDVQSIMGEPENSLNIKDNGVEKEIWIFSHPKVASEPPRCIFDRKSDTVIEIIIGENYH